MFAKGHLTFGFFTIHKDRPGLENSNRLVFTVLFYFAWLLNIQPFFQTFNYDL